MKTNKPMRKFIEFEIKEADDKSRTLRAIASTAARDRDGDIIDQKAWKLANFRKNPVILWAHNRRELPIGKAIEVGVENEKLMFKVQFAGEDMNPKGQQVFNMFKSGFLRTFSVGFLPFAVDPLTEEDKKRNPRPGPFGEFGRRIKAELLEISAVPVPSNPQALALREFKELLGSGMVGDKDGGRSPADDPEEVSEERMQEILPHHFSDGAVNPDALKACMGLVLGARGGINVTSDEKEAAYFHLVKHYEEAEMTAPTLTKRGYDELKEMFADVWDGELLDMAAKAQELTPPPAEKRYTIGKGAVAQLISVRDGLTDLIEKMKDDPPKPGEPPKEPAPEKPEEGDPPPAGEEAKRTERALQSINKDLDAISKI